ncbi:hypothetical protein TNCV_2052141 [Trichonephila clavipes]|nr:hypothetical protein TNCV_2052141 [Trichonephila clavipes]
MGNGKKPETETQVKEIVMSSGLNPSCSPENYAALLQTAEVQKYGKFTEDCIPDGVFPIGDDVFVFASTYYDSVSVHIRRFKKYGKTCYPTPEGITLDPRWIEYIMRKRKCRNHWRNYQVDFSLLNDTFK